MNRSAVDRLRDIIDATEMVVKHAGGLDAATLTKQHLQRDAALFRIAVIGEAVTHLPNEITALAPEIPWLWIKDMRNRIVHGYWQIDNAIVARTIAVRLDPLKSAAARLIILLERTQ